MTLVPEYFFKTFDMASAEFLSSIGVKGIVLDVDNTLEPYENPLPREEVINWINELEKAGIKAVIVSNNNHKRIDLFNSKLNLPVFCKAKKPFKRNILRAMEVMDTTKENTVMMGDQIFTDILAGHNAGIRAILVPPINDKKDLFTKFKRLLEKPILKKYMKLHSKNGG